MSGFLLVIDRLVRLSGTKSLYWDTHLGEFPFSDSMKDQSSYRSVIEKRLVHDMFIYVSIS